MDRVKLELCDNAGRPLPYHWAGRIVHTLPWLHWNTIRVICSSSWEIDEDVTLPGLSIKVTGYEDDTQVNYRYEELEKQEVTLHKGQVINYEQPLRIRWIECPELERERARDRRIYGEVSPATVRIG